MCNILKPFVTLKIQPVTTSFLAVKLCQQLAAGNNAFKRENCEI